MPINRYLWRGPICSEKAYMMKLKISALTIDKFKDANNHNYNTLQLQDFATKSTFNVYFINERSGFFENVQIGDTIIKSSGSLDFNSSNPCLLSPMKFDCDEKNFK